MASSGLPMPNQTEQLSPGTALITGADRGLGFGLTQELLNRGWTVIAGRNLDWHELKELAPKFPQTLHILDLDVTSQESADAAAQAATSLISHLDILICNAGINRSAHINSIREDQNYQDMLDELNINAIGCLRIVKAFLPLMDQGNHKRLCFVSSEAGSVAASKRTGWFGYCMSKAGLNIAVKNLSNDLTPQGYEFRLYHPGWMRTYMRGTKNLAAELEPEEAANFALKHFLSADHIPLVLRDFAGKDYPW